MPIKYQQTTNNSKHNNNGNLAVTLTVLSADPVKTNRLFPVDWKHAMAETFLVCPEQDKCGEEKQRVISKETDLWGNQYEGGLSSVIW